MKISIVTASYNQGAFIKRCLDSVRDQTGDVQIEHIILDNCSTDSTPQHLAEYVANPGRVDVRLIVERDGGQTAAINKGFTLATGDVVCWLNTDEWYEPDALLKVATYFRAHPSTDVVFGSCDFVDKNGAFLRRQTETFFSKSMLTFYRCYIPSCSTFVRRAIIDEGILLDPSFKIIMDGDWYVRIANAGHKFGIIKDLLASFTWHDTNISTSHPGRGKLERRKIMDELGNIGGPSAFRTVVYKMLRLYWQAVRFSRRTAGRYSNAH